MRVGLNLPHACNHAQRNRRTAETEEGVFREEIIMCVALLSWPATVWARSDREATADRMDHAGQCHARDHGRSRQRNSPRSSGACTCVAVVPHLLKGGFVFGAENGRGVATCRTANGWSAPAFFAITGGSWGLQIGVEGVDLVMIIQNERGMQQLISSGFQIGGDASAAAGPVGRHASADTDWKMNTEILTYSRAAPLPESRSPAPPFAATTTP